jgi:hypothetical protein
VKDSAWARAGDTGRLGRRHALARTEPNTKEFTFKEDVADLLRMCRWMVVASGRPRGAP